MENRIAGALARLFERHRIVFWYDAKRELRDAFEALSLPGVEKLELANNEYGVKYRILREQPEQKFLLYREGPQPADLDNWLLDVQLAHGEFRTDQAALWLSELELGLEFADLVQDHAEFFQAGKRREALKRLLQADDTPGLIRLKMLAVCTVSEPRLDAIVEQLLDELSVNSEKWEVGSGEGEAGRGQGAEEPSGEKFKLIQRCKLDEYFWEQMKRQYGYVVSEPGIRDFVIQLFKDCYYQNFTSRSPLLTSHSSLPTSHSSLPTPHFPLSADALVFLKRWKDSRRFEAGFETLSDECAEVLGIEQDLAQRDFRELIELDYFRLIDQKIVSDLVRAVAARTVTSGDVALWVRQRRQGHWYGEYRHLYAAVDHAARFMEQLSVVGDPWSESTAENGSPASWIERYARTWYRLDQLYRKFTYRVRRSGQTSLMGELTEQIENLYVNRYLLKLNDRWQVVVDSIKRWEAAPVVLQKHFFERWVRPFLRKDIRVCVIISDALRYEIGEELLGLIRHEDRYTAELEPMLSMLPSYTQLGMAALLPNQSLAIADNDTGTVRVNGQSAQGTANRSGILKAALNGRADAITSEALMAMNRDDSRALLKANDVLYVYHNRIDHTGDKLHSEGQAFEAAEQTLDDLLRLVKKLTAANANNLLITADHGFIYQNRAIDESDFVSGQSPVASSQQESPSTSHYYFNRRFVLGKNLPAHPGLCKFTSAQLGLAGDMEAQIPKSINRLRLKGSGSRFVHGGASLQEVVIPVLRINKKRQSDVSAVEVEILRGSSSVITSGQLAVVFYQTRPVTDKVQPRRLRAGLYTEAGELISDSHDLSFDLASENARERELPVRFVLTRKADEVNGQEVVLKLEEQYAGTSHFKDYKSLRYVMRRSFTSDFDF